MTHQELLARRDTPDSRDLAPGCQGQLVYVGWYDIGDADWELFHCPACRQYIHRDTEWCHGDTWSGISPNDTVTWLDQKNRLIRKPYRR